MEYLQSVLDHLGDQGILDKPKLQEFSQKAQKTFIPALNPSKKTELIRKDQMKKEIP